MRELDIVSVVVAALLGAGLYTLIEVYMNDQTPSGSIIGTGAAVGAGVQIGVRLFGVS